MAVIIDGTESDELLTSLATLDPIVALLNTHASLSRVHGSRRVFDVLKKHSVETSVIHHREFAGQPLRDDVAIVTGSEIGGLLVDGLGDGVLLEVLSEDVDYLRTTSFALLQVPPAAAPLHLSVANWVQTRFLPPQLWLCTCTCQQRAALQSQSGLLVHRLACHGCGKHESSASG